MPRLDSCDFTTGIPVEVNVIITGCDPAFLADALRTIGGQHVTFEVKQNTLSSQRKVCHCPPVISGLGSRRIRWVVMPVSTGVEPSRESLGSNFRETAVAVISSI